MKKVFLSLLLIPLVISIAYGQELNTIKLVPTDDAYVVSDITNFVDNVGLRDLNTGDAGFLKIWYAFNVTENQEKILSAGYLKFDLTELDADDIQIVDMLLAQPLSESTVHHD